MLCPNCKTAAQIRRTETVVRGDESPDTSTEVVLIQEFVCRNPRCDSCGEVIGTAEHLLYPRGK